MASIRKNTKAKKAFGSDLMSEVIIGDTPSTSFTPIYKSLQKNSYDSDLSDLSFYWPKSEENIRQQLLSRKYLLSPYPIFIEKDGKYNTRWLAVAAVMLKALSLMLSNIIKTNVGDKCYRFKDCGGSKGAIRKTGLEVLEYKYVLKSDIADFYSSMNHGILLVHCKEIIKDKRIIRILYQYMNRLEDLAGRYKLIVPRIFKGRLLFPSMGVFSLKSLGKVAGKKFVCIRYMDDWLILAKTQDHLREIIRKMHQVMKEIKLKLALDKTYIGKIQKGFEFLGYRRFNDKGLVLALKTINNFKERAMKLYEQDAIAPRIHCYVRHCST